jgi:hypothetical protein
MGAASSDTATAKFTFLSTSTTGRTYEIKVTQIACSDINRYLIPKHIYYLFINYKNISYVLYKNVSTF